MKERRGGRKKEIREKGTEEERERNERERESKRGDEE